MKRVLTFDGDDPKSAKRFEMIFEAVMQAGDKTDKRDRALVRKEARVIEALEAISEPSEKRPVTCGHCGSDLTSLVERHVSAVREPRHLKPGAQIVTLQGEDHELMTKYVDTVPWLPVAARAAVDVQDFVGAAEKVD